MPNTNPPCAILARDFLSFQQIAEQYPGTVAPSTLYVWASTRRYDFDRIVTKIGGRSRIRRDRWEAFLEARTACTTSEAEVA